MATCGHRLDRLGAPGARRVTPNLQLVGRFSRFACWGQYRLQRRQSVPGPAALARKAILDTLRPTLEKELKQKIQFQVHQLAIEGDWAFLFAAPQQPNGKAPDYGKTRYREAVRAGAFDNGVAALFRRTRRSWRLVTHVLGATDVPWMDWPRRFGAPKQLFTP